MMFLLTEFEFETFSLNYLRIVLINYFFLLLFFFFVYYIVNYKLKKIKKLKFNKVKIYGCH